MTFFQYLHHVDKDITIAINSANCVITDFIWQFFSHIQIWFVMYFIVAVMLFVKLGWKKALIVIASVALTIVACDQFSNLIKNAVQRLRPCHDLDMIGRGLNILEDKGGLYGFFSAHAANAMGFAVSTWKGFKNDAKGNYNIYGTAIVLWALLVSISRAFVGKHFFGDICVGMAVGLMFGYLFASIATRICKKI